MSGTSSRRTAPQRGVPRRHWPTLARARPILIWAALVAGLAPAHRTAAQAAVETVATGGRVMAAVVSEYELGLLSGLFLTDPESGWILFRRSRDDEPARIPFSEFERQYEFQNPTGMVFAEPRLYVYDAATQTVSSILVQGREYKAETRKISRLREHPTHIAVSPHGLVAVIEEGEVVFLQEDHEPVRYERLRFADPIDLAFSAWDTLEVLDGVRNALVSITFSRLKSGEILFNEEGEVPVPRVDRGQRWQAMAIYEGLVYLADQTTVYAYLAADRSLVPVTPPSGAPRRVRDHRLLSRPGDPRSAPSTSQLALTRESLYLLESDHIRRLPRAQPVDLALEGGPLDSQWALMAAYTYLRRNDVLPTQHILARRTYERLDEFLVENGVLLVAGTVSAAPRRSRKESYGGAGEEQEFLKLLCDLNTNFCRESGAPGRSPSLSLATRVPQRTELVVPWVQLTSRLGRKTVDLGGENLRNAVERWIPSPELREKVDDALLLRLNPGWKERDLQERRKGTATVPVELWTAMPAVPASDYRDPGSPLWALTRRYGGVEVFGREVFTEQAARSRPLPPPPPDDADCETLRQKHREWLEAIHYPVIFRPASQGASGSHPAFTATLTYPELGQEDVRVGVLEYNTTVKTNHQAFCQDATAPSWHDVADFDLVARPTPASYSDVSLDLQDATTFSPEAHHGTHVAAIIAGRQCKCWSGLLPRARLLLVDLKDNGQVRRAIMDGVNADTRVFNVSQAFDGPRDALYDTITENRSWALFVAAAGNEHRDLNGVDAASVPAPARWGAEPNVIAVTGSDWDGHILDSDFNHGKRYVDLVAPGRDVYSASEPPGHYGPGSGTSQATPQVTAAAAMLVDSGGEAHLSPGDAKARLIATAEWDDAYEDEVWGGRLDFGAAVRFPNRSFIVTTTGEAHEQIHTLELDNDPWIEIRGGPTYYERTGTGVLAPRRIRFSRILSLRKNEGAERYRVVLREPGTDHLKILLDVELKTMDEKIRCDEFELFDRGAVRFEPSNGCDSDLRVEEIEQYFRGGAYQIRWE